MNAFSLIMLAWPLYLAVNGKLADYVSLAKPGAHTASGQDAGKTGTAANAADSGSSDTAYKAMNMLLMMNPATMPFGAGLMMSDMFK